MRPSIKVKHALDFSSGRLTSTQMLPVTPVLPVCCHLCEVDCPKERRERACLWVLLSWRAPTCQLSSDGMVSWVLCFTLLLLVSYLVYHVLRATAAQGLSCLIELWLPWVAERSNFILHGEFCKPRYVTAAGGNLALKVCVKEPGVELTGILKGVYGNLLPCFPRRCSWSWVPNLRAGSWRERKFRAPSTC